MSISRRKTLSLIGGGAILAAGGAAGVAVSRKPGQAIEPWSQAGDYEDPRMRALSYAILAPNPHNRQPWKVDLRVPGQVALYVDTDRLLPHTDPFNRQIVIGLGCFLETLRLAALDAGQAVTFDLFPDGSDPDRLDARSVAVCSFAPTDAPRDPLFDHVMARRSLKEPYDTARPVPEAALDMLAGAVRRLEFGGTVDAGEVGYWRDLTRQALLIELETDHTYKESVDLFRIGADEVNANPDGIDFSGPMFETMHLTGMFTREKALDRKSLAYTGGIDAVLANCDTAMGMVWLVSDDNSRAAQIAAGADWVRLNLALTGAGIGTQPMSQALQEYPEMAPLYDEVHEALAPGGGTVQMLARIGYGPQVGPSPRWPVERKVMHG